MMTVTPYIKLPDDLVPAQVLNDWREKCRKKQPVTTCPGEVLQFIKAMAAKLGNFGQFRKYIVMWPGSELLLSGVKEIKGERVVSFASYPLDVPVMQFVDPETSMLRLYRFKGKQGLIDFCKAKVKGTDLERVLDILTVHVFHEHRPEYKQALRAIQQAKQLEAA